MRPVLDPASPVLRRDAAHLQLGTDPIDAVVVRDLPGVADLFASAVYVRGGLTLDALRRAIGDRHFFEVLRRWVSQRSGGHGTTDQLIALSERVSGRQLDALFDQWLFTPGRPPLPGE